MRMPPVAASLLLTAILVAAALGLGSAFKPASVPGPSDEGKARDTADASTGAAASAARDPVSSKSDFAWVAGVDQGQLVVLGNGGILNVPDGARTLTVSAAWNCVSPTCALKAEIGTKGSVSREVTGTGSLNTTIDDPAAGDWGAWFFSDGATGGVRGTVTVTATFAR